MNPTLNILVREGPNVDSVVHASYGEIIDFRCSLRSLWFTGQRLWNNTFFFWLVFSSDYGESRKFNLNGLSEEDIDRRLELLVDYGSLFLLGFHS